MNMSKGTQNSTSCETAVIPYVRMANEIKCLSQVQLLIRKKHVQTAINFWRENKEQAPKDRVDYNVKYFTTELNLIEKRLK